jgi:amidase
MQADDVHYLELTEVARRIRVGALSPVALTRALLDRIEKLDGRLRAYATVTPELALEQAQRAEAEIGRGMIRGPLHGVPIAVKDLCYTRGLPTAAGMPIHAGFRPDHDATVVTRLTEAGAVILGKLQLTEGAFAEHHPEIPPPVNPWHPEHWSGASSSGSGVATAAGLCYASLGSDTGGSIRFPSAANGVSGIKPTWGRVSRYGVFPLAESLDHIGPMTRSAADAAAVLGVIAGPDAHDPTALQAPVPNYLAGLERGIRGLRLGVDPELNRGGVDAPTVQVVEEAVRVLAELGAEVREVRFPPIDAAVESWLALCGVETALAHASTYPSQAERYGGALKGLIEVGRDLGGTELARILLIREELRGRVAALFQDIDLLAIPAQFQASPTIAQMATLGEDPDAINRLLRFTAPFDMTGSPTITLTGGFTPAGLPIAFQLVARHLEEDLLCRAGHAFQLATDWHRRRPPL